MIPQHRTTQRSDASMFCHHFVFFIFSTFLQKQPKKLKIVLFVVQFQGKRPYRKLPYKKYKRPSRAKRPPTTDRAERLTLIRENRPTPPTSAGFPLFQRPTTPQTSASTNFCLGSSSGHIQLCMQAIDQKEVQLPVSKI